MTDSKKAAVVGSGISGLAAAIRLAVLGWSVTVFEGNSYVGGKIAERRENGYRFDRGPSVLTMPQYIDELFELAGENPRDHFNYHRLDPIFQYFFDDGTLIRTRADSKDLVAELESKTSVKAKDLYAYFKRSKEKLELTDEVFLQRSLHQWENYLDWPTLRGVLNFHRIEAFTTMAKANAKLLKDEKVAAIFNQYASYNGSSPYLAPATLNLISHYEITLGAYYPLGGMRTIPKALFGLAERLGVRFRLNSKVTKLNTAKGQVNGLEVGGEQYPFDVVVSNSDVFKTYHSLMPEQAKPTRTLSQPKSSSVIVFYWGIKQEFPELKLHNMFMSGNSKQEYHHIFSEQTVYEDPTVYLYVSSKQNKDDAPAGCENWFAMVTVPHNSGQDWDKLVAKTRSSVLQKLNKRLNADIEPLIEEESVLDPRSIEKYTSSAFGSVYGNSSNGKFAAFLRHPNFTSKIKNLYFCGGSVHPGSSIPLCLLSAKITEGLVKKRHS